jgi:hypothetical protein
MCRTFRRVLKATLPSGQFTTFPHPNYPALNELMDTLNRVYEEDPTKAPKIVFVMEGTFHGNNSEVNINYPLIMIGAGRNETFLTGYNLRIGGTKEEGKEVIVQNMTSSNAGYGLFGNGLSFLCDRMTFTQCINSGVIALNTKGRLINCVITQCQEGGIKCGENTLIQLEGSQTKVDGNGTYEPDGDNYDYGLMTFNSSSRIHLLFPLTKESVSTNNEGGGNYGGNGLIAIVDDDGNTIEIINEVTEVPDDFSDDY